MKNYTYNLIGNKRYEITTNYEGEEITFHVVVATGEEQIDELVQFHLDTLSKPMVTYTPSYRDKRKAEYPEIGDQLDALWKGGEALAEMSARIQAVKTKYPKPE